MYVVHSTSDNNRLYICTTEHKGKSERNVEGVVREDEVYQLRNLYKSLFSSSFRCFMLFLSSNYFHFFLLLISVVNIRSLFG